jgi:hypothetical protein
MVLQTRGVDDREVEIAEPRPALAAVAGDAGLVVDQSEPASHQPVEQRGFADVGSADNGNSKIHDAMIRLRGNGLARDPAKWNPVRR